MELKNKSFFRYSIGLIDTIRLDISVACSP